MSLFINSLLRSDRHRIGRERGFPGFTGITPVQILPGALHHYQDSRKQDQSVIPENPWRDAVGKGQAQTQCG